MELFYRKYGEGPPLIIIHGLYGSSDNWISIARILAKHFEVFLIDQRNHGRSGHSDEHNYLLMRDDLKEFMDTHKIEKPIILGHSMGGKTAMYFATELPERVSYLIVVDISPVSYLSRGMDSSQFKAHNTIINALYNIDFNTIESREQVNQILTQNIPEERLRQFLLKNLHRAKGNIFSWKLNIESIKKSLLNIVDGLDPDDFIYGDQITGFPVLFIKGSDSDYILDKDIEAIEKIFPYADVTTIKNAGHWVHAEQPEKFIRAVMSFILE